jgi:hypothetical protein
MRITILATFLMFVHNFCFSQTAYRKGYIITNARDTLSGFVEYREGLRAYRSCNFKQSKDHGAVTYAANQIVAYSFVDDKLFESKKIHPAEKTEQTVFLEVIVKGLVGLYRFEDTYWVSDNQTLYELTNEYRDAVINDVSVKRRTHHYVGILNLLLSDCRELKLRIQKSILSEKPLTKLIEDYNICKGSPAIVFKAKKALVKLIVGATGGVNISNVHFKERGYSYEHLSGAFKTSKTPNLGLSLDILSPKFNERISFHADLVYMTTRHYQYSRSTSALSMTINYVTIELQQLKLPLGVRYTFPEKTFTPYVNAGMCNTFHLSRHSTWIQEMESNHLVKTSTREALPIKKGQLGFWGGIGVLKSISHKLNLSAEIRYEPTDGIVPFSLVSQQLQSKMTNLQINLGIRTK